MIEDVLFTDYHQVVRKEERGNIYQLGLAGGLNRTYIDPFLNQSFEVDEQYQGEHEEVKTKFEAALDELNSEQLDRIEFCKKVLKGEADELDFEMYEYFDEEESGSEYRSFINPKKKAG